VPEGMSEKDMALKIYSVLTDRFKEKPGGITNYIDSPKENGYQSFHVKLLADFGRWQEVHISSERMVHDSRLGCMAQRSEDNIARWIDKFRAVLRDLAEEPDDSTDFIERVVTSFYNDDIMTFTRDGRPVVMPQHATVLDFAYELGREVGSHAKYARLNNFLASIKAPLRRGDVVEVFTSSECHPKADWLDVVVTYKAKKEISDYLSARPCPVYSRCPVCNPIPEEEVIGFRERNGRISIHKRDCKTAIRLATQHGDDILSVDFQPEENTLYPVTIAVTAVDRYHLFIDIVDCITNELHLTIDSFNTATTDSIVTCTISFSIHSAMELETIMNHIALIPGVDEVKRQV
ncbi:MAG: TGS domain-containing protein, partial [Muribaculaceae bacterium]|nr:TGS domain-containing protein [Muribaculaceae bacterium]